VAYLGNLPREWLASFGDASGVGEMEEDASRGTTTRSAEDCEATLLFDA